MTKQYDLITILGPTASGKTALAVRLAHYTDGEIISADSRQVYREMDIGTGKDMDEYRVNGAEIPSHLIDVAEAGEAYDLFRYLNDFMKAFGDIRSRGRQALLCGGSGMYLEAVIRGYRLNEVPVDTTLREQWASLSHDQLVEMLQQYRTPHNTTDTDDRDRLIRALEIAVADSNGYSEQASTAGISHLIIGIDIPRPLLRKRITERLHKRLQEGLVDEVQNLLDSGVPPDKLRYYGLEYRFVTDYLTDIYDYETMVALLNTAIHQFAKRQMTWFRRMEKKNILIHWINGDQDVAGMLNDSLKLL
jgi:tRNA dimethylallyltransferase